MLSNFDEEIKNKLQLLSKVYFIFLGNGIKRMKRAFHDADIVFIALINYILY